MASVNLRAANGSPYVGRGIYDVNEVARLVRCSPLRVKRWTRWSAQHGPALLSAELDERLFSFRDLISVRAIAALAGRCVPIWFIAIIVDYLARELQTDRPFAHEHLSTVSAGFFACYGENWANARIDGPQAFKNIIEPLSLDIDFDEHHMAARWRPAVGVSIDPAIQAGAPCVEGTRVPTSLIAAAVADGNGDTASRRTQVCDDYRLTDTQLQHALNYEQSLDARPV